jgi:hypothetical protein
MKNLNITIAIIGGGAGESAKVGELGWSVKSVS